MRVELDSDKVKMAIEDIQKYFDEERDESIGDLQGALLLEFIADKIGPYFYNQGVNDAQKYLEEKVEDLYSFLA